MAYEIHPWKVIETGFEPDKMRLSESLTSTGNGYICLLYTSPSPRDS